MKLKRLLIRRCPRSGGSWPTAIPAPVASPARSLFDYQATPRLSKPERADRRRHRRAQRGRYYLDPAPTPRLALDDPERRRLQAEVLAVGRCQNPACGTKYRLTMDHIVPLDLGGGNHRANLQCLCKACNKAKGRAIWAPGMPFPLAA